MRALQYTTFGEQPELVDVDPPVPGPGQVLVQVQAAGLCHTDIGVLSFPREMLDAWRITLPTTLGHETAGTVVSTGEGVAALEIGTNVAVYGAWGCGNCVQCARGEENLCERRDELGLTYAGLGSDGGMAEYMVVDDARHLVPIGDLDPAVAAILPDAGITSYRAIRRSLSKLVAGSTVLVIGVGGLGHVAIQLLKALSAATVVAIDTSEAKLQLARECGADVVLDAGADVPARVEELTGLGAHVVLDFVGSESTTKVAEQCVRQGGDISIVGVGGGAASASMAGPPEITVRTIYWGSRSDLIAVVELARQGVITPRLQRYPLEDARSAFDDLTAGRIQGRAVLIP
ncbi:NAD(P)-dependent alcohol dehydrogenase [Geodermatophilus sp. URMC 62]|uniref:NAD(P)-dependent alcohol dehydrogenase n=1 Tax=Geodermatophilus sp. URMC 62 TaxID=3423414 RepID=UPI00406D2BBD